MIKQHKYRWCITTKGCQSKQIAYQSWPPLAMITSQHWQKKTK